jgi:hypothetical protein
LEVHHLQPVIAGGEDTLPNLQLLCEPCHQKADTEARLAYPVPPNPDAKRRGPKPKPRSQLYVMCSFRLPPGLWAEVMQWIPKGERSARVQECRRLAAARLAYAEGRSEERRPGPKPKLPPGGQQELIVVIKDA